MSFDIVTISLNRLLRDIDGFPQPVVPQIAFGHLGKNQRIVGIQVESLLVFLDGLRRLASVVQHSRFREVIIRFGTRSHFRLSNSGGCETRG